MHYVYFLCRFMKQVRPNGIMEDSPLPSPVTSPNHPIDVVGVSVGGEGEEPNHRKGVKRSLEDVEGKRKRGRRGRRRGEREGERKREDKSLIVRGHKSSREEKERESKM